MRISLFTGILSKLGFLLFSLLQKQRFWRRAPIWWNLTGCQLYTVLRRLNALLSSLFSFMIGIAHCSSCIWNWCRRLIHLWAWAGWTQTNPGLFPTLFPCWEANTKSGCPLHFIQFYCINFLLLLLMKLCAILVDFLVWIDQICILHGNLMTLWKGGW